MPSGTKELHLVFLAFITKENIFLSPLTWLLLSVAEWESYSGTNATSYIHSLQLPEVPRYNTHVKSPWLLLSFYYLGYYPSGVKISGPNSTVRGRGITRLLESISSSSNNIHRFSNCETSLSPYMPQKDGYKSFSSFS